MTIIQNARTSGGGVVTNIPAKAFTVGPVETWKSDKVSIWHPGWHDNRFFSSHVPAGRSPECALPLLQRRPGKLRGGNALMPVKTLDIPYIHPSGRYPELPDLSAEIEKSGGRIQIDTVNWPDYGYQPDVSMFCGYTDDEILLKYRVHESHIRADNTELNSEVYKDSCVEFFISTGTDFFYNFEFNCIGTAYAAYGTPCPVSGHSQHWGKI